MKIKYDNLVIPAKLLAIYNRAEETVNTEALHSLKTQAQIASFVLKLIVQLTKVKLELHKTIDAGFTDAESFRLGEGNSCVDYSTPPSVFLEKAYTLQTYGEDGNPIENREQPYIDAGVAFAVSDEVATNREKIILNDAGKMTSAINNILSQLNKILAQLNKMYCDPSDDSDVESLGHLIANPVGLHNQIEVLVDVAQSSPMINYVPHQNNFHSAISAIVELFQSMVNYLSQLGKTETQRNQQRFFAVQAKYPATPATAAITTALPVRDGTTPSPRSDSDEEGEMLPNAGHFKRS